MKSTKQVKHCLMIFLSVIGTLALLYLLKPLSASADQLDKYEERNLMKAFRFTELTEKSGSRDIPHDTSMVPVDINSNVYISISPEKFPIATGLLLKTALKDIKKRRDALLGVLIKIKELVDTSKNILRLNRELYNSKGEPRYKMGDRQYKRYVMLENEFKNSTKTHGRLIRVITEQAYIYVAAKEDYKLMSDKIDDILEDDNFLRIVQTKYPEIEESPKSPEFARFFTREFADMDAEIRSRKAEIAKTGRKVKLRLRARLFHKNKEESAIHLPGYDNLKQGPPVITDKLSFQLDDRSRRELKEEVEIHAEFARYYNEIREGKSEIFESIIKELNALRNEVVVFARILRENQIDTDFIEREVIQNLRSLEKKVSGKPGVANKIKSLVKNATHLKRNVEKFFEIIESLSKIPAPGEYDVGGLLVDLPQSKLKDVEHLMKLLEKDNTDSIPHIIENLGKTLNELETALKSAGLEQAVMEEAEKLVQSITKKVQEQYLTTMKVLEDKFVLLKKIKNEFDKKTKKYLFPAAYLSQVALDCQAIDVPLSQVHDTKLEIIRTPRKQGDRIVLEAELAGEDGKVIREDSFVFKIEKFGLHSKISANMIFVKRAETPPGEKEINFVAAPGVSYTFRYRTRGNHGVKRFWDFLNAGLGVNTAVLSFQDSGLELGIGGTLSLFGDILQAGFGYNLQVREKQDYYFIGIGLLEMVEAFRNPQKKVPSSSP